MPRLALYRPFSLLMALVLTIVASVHAEATLQAGTSDLNKAGQLRMLSQRVAKLALQQRLNILPDRTRLEMAQSISQFDSLLADLNRLNTLPRLVRPLAGVSRRWSELKPQLGLADPDTLHVFSEDLTLAISQITNILEDETGTQSGRLVDLAQRQTMLSQRMAKLYLLNQLGRNTSVDLQITRSEFLTALNELNGAQQNTQRIRGQLELAKGQWFFYEKAIAVPRNTDLTQLENVATTSERISQVMQEIVGDYRKLY